MEILARLNQEKLDHTKDNAAHLVVSLKTPTLDWITKRPALCVLPLIDLSGSMQGPKLEYAKKSLLKLIDHLQEGDVAGLVAFESRAHVLVPPQEVTADFKHVLREAVGKMHVMGGTNLSGGLLKAIEVIHHLDLSMKYIKRVIMFTDGEPTEGITNPDQILRLMDKSRGNVTVSAFGYGSDRGGITGSCDLKFLTKLSEEGKGNFAYVKDPDDALAAFGKELGGLLSTYATDLDIEIEPMNGHHITKVVTNVEAEEDGIGAYSISIPDILAEETRHFVFEAKLVEQNKAFPRASAVFGVKLTYSILLEDGRREVRSTETKARVQFVRPSDADKSPVRDVDEIVSLHKMIRTQLDAEELAKKGKYDVASLLMKDAADLATFNGYTHVAAAASEIQTRLGSQALYASSQGFLRSVANIGTRGYGSSAADEDAVFLMNDCNVVTSNALMDSMISAFTDEGPSTPETAVPFPDLLGTPGPALWVTNEPLTIGAVDTSTNFDADVQALWSNTTPPGEVK